MAQGLTLVVDSSAWISFYRKEDSAAKYWMVDAFKSHALLVPDLVLLEVLRGLKSEKLASAIEREFENFEIVLVGGKPISIKAAKNYRILRCKGITIRGTVDLFIATWCIENNIPLLHADRDFKGFEEHLGLKVWRGD